MLLKSKQKRLKRSFKAHLWKRVRHHRGSDPAEKTLQVGVPLFTNTTSHFYTNISTRTPGKRASFISISSYNLNWPKNGETSTRNTNNTKKRAKFSLYCSLYISYEALNPGKSMVHAHALTSTI